MYSFIGKKVYIIIDHLGSSTDPCCIQNSVIMNRVIKRLRCITILKNLYLKGPKNMVGYI